MAAYYNEFDPFAAAWLRELIKAGHIAPGEVDERSILEVQPDDLRGFTQCHFFAGIGVWSYALRCAGWPDDRFIWSGSCPCQPFSAAGKQEGHADERHLAPVWLRLIEECRPAIVIGEQVSAAVGMGWLDALFIQLEQADYACGAAVFPACSVGAPHIRQRLYFVAESSSARVRDCGPGEDAGAPRGSESEGHQRKRLRHDAGDDRSFATGELADAGRNEQSARRGNAGEMCGLPNEERGPEDGAALPRGSGGAGDMGHPSRGGLGERGDAPPAGSSGHPDGAEQPCVMVYAEQPGLEGFAGHGDDGDRPGRDGALAAGSTAAASEPRATGAVEHTDRTSASDGEIQRGGELGRPAEDARPGATRDNRPRRTGEAWLESAERGRREMGGPVNGFWANAEWLPCRDGKARPVEPGTSPLAHGAPNRVGRLRGYGNAINAPQAEEFVRAFMEISQ